MVMPVNKRVLSCKIFQITNKAKVESLQSFVLFYLNFFYERQP